MYICPSRSCESNYVCGQKERPWFRARNGKVIAGTDSLFFLLI